MDIKELGKKLHINWHEVSQHQFEEGMKVETEHKDVTHGDPVKTAKIALAHIKEVPDYYSRLSKMEKTGKKAMKKKSSK